MGYVHDSKNLINPWEKLFTSLFNTKHYELLNHRVWVSVIKYSFAVIVRELMSWLWTLHSCSGTKSSGLHTAWASLSSEQSGWQRTRHQCFYYKGLKTDRAPAPLASLHPWILHNKFHSIQRVTCPPFMTPRGRGPMDLLVFKCPLENRISI